jgi:hypothetical protein
MNPHEKCRRFLTVLVLNAFTMSALAETVSGTPLMVDTQSRREVVRFFQQEYSPGSSVEIGWNGNAELCEAGATAVAYAEATIHRVNFFRAMAGLPATVAYDASLNGPCQEAALMMSRQDRLSHDPETSWTCYTESGARAAQRSNLYLGLAGPEAIDGYMDDPRTKNYFVGHRRWLLYPPQRSMGTGSVPGDGSRLPANCLWVLSSFADHPGQPEWVAWPPQGFVPHSLLPRASGRWSFSFRGAGFAKSEVRMSLNGENIPLTLEKLENNRGHGENTLVWVPRGIPTTAPIRDLSYEISINNVVVDGRNRAFSYVVTVIDPAADLNIVDSNFPQAIQGSPYWFQLEASSGQPPYSWSLVPESGTLPDGFSLGENGVLSGEPRAAGTFDFRIQVTDADAVSINEAVRITVREANEPVKILTETLPEGQTGPGSFYTAQLEADGGLPPYLWSLSSGSQPPPSGITFSESGRISGSPQQGGTFELEVRVQDARGVAAEKSFALFILSPLRILSSPLEEAVVGRSYTAQVKAEGGRPPYSWSVSPPSALPEGLTISQEGWLTGTPMEEGDFMIRARVSDAAGMQVEQELKIVVARGRLKILSDELAGATFGQDYAFELEAEGGIPPYTWSIDPVVSTLPQGLVLESQGGILGRPEEIGVFLLEIALSDSEGERIQWAVPLVVWAAALELRIPWLPAAQLSQSGSGIVLQADAPGAVEIEWSPNLTTWSTLRSFFVEKPLTEWNDPEARASPVRFYRARHP